MTEDRTAAAQGRAGHRACNITKCCTEVCPESINITDNAIIPLKERVVDEFYDPIKKLLQDLFRGTQSPPPETSPPASSGGKHA